MVGVPPPDAGEDCAAAGEADEHRAIEITIMTPGLWRRILNMENLGGKKPRKVHAAAPVNNFGAAFFHKFYLNPATRVVSAAEMRARASTIAAALQQCEIPVRSILDAGCGIGLLRKPFAKLLPRARYTGLEASGYLCRRYGWIQGSIADLHRSPRLAVPHVLHLLTPTRHAALHSRAATRAARRIGPDHSGLARESIKTALTGQ